MKEEVRIWARVDRAAAAVSARVGFGSHDLGIVLPAFGADQIVGVIVLIPLMFAIVAEQDVAPLDRLEAFAPGSHLGLPGLVISGEGGNAEAEC